MNAEESKVLQDFLDQLVQAKGIAKDPQAEALIAQAVARQPDAAYLLVQRALLLDHALTQTREQVARLQQELQAVRTTGNTSVSSFLDPANTWGRSASDVRAQASPTVAPAAMPVPAQQFTPAAMPPVAARPGFFGGNAGGFLSNVAATAAGVAGGAFLFQGIEHLLGSQHQAPGLFGASGLMDRPVENTTVNNFFSSDSALGDLRDDSLNTDFDNFTDDDGTTSI